MMTGNFTSIARPYALAAYEYALSKNALAAWEELLHVAATVAEDPLIIQLMSNPDVKRSELGDLFCDILRSVLDPAMKNFICLLAERNRFAVLPAMAEQFKFYRAEHEKKITVEASSAIPLDPEQRKRLTQALTKRLKREVTLRCNVNPDLLGGVIVHIGDKVIDGSVRGKLNRLFEFI